MCVNQNGGYLCVPRTNPVYRSPYLNPYSNIYPPPPAPGPVPNYPTVTRPLICRFGYQLDENNQCAGKKWKPLFYTFTYIKACLTLRKQLSFSN